MRTEFSEMTILTIAHRLNTILDYDRVMVLDEGQIVEFDTPKKLFDQSGSIFRSMCLQSNISPEDIKNSTFGNSEKHKISEKVEKRISEDFGPAKGYDATDF